MEFQSTLSMRRATPDRRRGKIDHRISIHALHEESDAGVLTGGMVIAYFNPRSP